MATVVVAVAAPTAVVAVNVAVAVTAVGDAVVTVTAVAAADVVVAEATVASPDAAVFVLFLFSLVLFFGTYRSTSHVFDAGITHVICGYCC